MLNLLQACGVRTLKRVFALPNLSRLLLGLLIATPLSGAATMATPAETVSADLGGLQLVFDARTGGLLKMSGPGAGLMLDAPASEASLLDVAYPIPDFEPLRFGARFSSGAHIEATSSSVVIRWERLGASRSKWSDAANISAVVRFETDPGGKSVITRCEIENKSTSPVRQVIFPDFADLLPFAGEAGTTYRTAGMSTTPFLELKPNEGRLSTQFCMDTAANAAEYKSGGTFHPMWLRWMDFGGLKGGFSIFPRQWGWDPGVVMRLHHSEEGQKIRMLYVHNTTIAPGAKWQSPEYVITAHEHGWAKGIEPYRDWVRAHFRRDFEMPRHVREGLGYRTIWMSQGWPEDPQDAVYTMKDLPSLARESKEHGLDEIVMWSWTRGFLVPIPPPLKNLGTPQEMADAVAECRKMGVHVAPFISVVLAAGETAARYGLKVSDASGWTQHTETVPRFNPGYSTLLASAMLGPANTQWQDEVLTSVKALMDLGIPSLSWDQFWNERPDNNMLSLAARIRAYQRSKDPEASFSGEELWNMELDSALLDYTWNWLQGTDCVAFLSVFPAPRINYCISSDPGAAKQAFMDNRYLNIFPRKPGSVNGSGWIKDHAEFSKTLKQCAKLRGQFLDYFTSGTLIGDCILTEPCPGARVRAYVLGGKLLVLVMNEGAEGRPVLKWNPAPWIEGQGGLTTTVHDMDGNVKSTEDVPRTAGQLGMMQLKTQELCVVEIKPKE